MVTNMHIQDFSMHEDKTKAHTLNMSLIKIPCGSVYVPEVAFSAQRPLFLTSYVTSSNIQLNCLMGE